MTPPSPLPAPRIKPTSRPRRVKRGVVAGYIHDISARHGVSEAVGTAAAATRATVARAEPRPA